jgi:RNA polymerase sigma factor (sigma-70 family)
VNTPEAIDQLVRKNQGLVYQFYQKAGQCPATYDRDGLLSDLQFHLFKAARYFDHRKSKFSTYAWAALSNAYHKWLVHERRRGFTKLDDSHARRQIDDMPTAIQFSQIGNDDTDEDFRYQIPSPPTAEIGPAEREALRKALRFAKPHELAVIELRARGLTKKQIGDRLGFTSMTAGNIIKKYTHILIQQLQG